MITFSRPICGSNSKVLYSGSGSLATGADAMVSVCNCQIPILPVGKLIKYYLTIFRDTGAENIKCCLYGTDATYTAFYPGTVDQAAAAWFCDGCVKKWIDASTYTFEQIGVGAIASGYAQGGWGNISTTANTIYFNVNQRAASTFKWSLLVVEEGDNVK